MCAYYAGCVCLRHNYDCFLLVLLLRPQYTISSRTTHGCSKHLVLVTHFHGHSKYSLRPGHSCQVMLHVASISPMCAWPWVSQRRVWVRRYRGALSTQSPTALLQHQLMSTRERNISAVTGVWRWEIPAFPLAQRGVVSSVNHQAPTTNTTNNL